MYFMCTNVNIHGKACPKKLNDYKIKVKNGDAMITSKQYSYKLLETSTTTLFYEHGFSHRRL